MRYSISMLFVAAIMMAGCGGSSVHYAGLKTIPGARSDTSSVDLIAQPSEWASHVTLADGHSVTVSIWKSASDAEDAASQYKPIASIDSSYSLDRVSNVVLAWDDKPTKADEKNVRDALSTTNVRPQTEVQSASNTSTPVLKGEFNVYPYPPAPVASFESGFDKAMVKNGYSYSDADSRARCLIDYAQHHWHYSEWVTHTSTRDAAMQDAMTACGS
jgi:hypothetical protein